MSKIKVLITDDAVVVRRILTTVIEADPELEVVGLAANGKIALQKIEQLKPDIITLDIEMPEMNGLETLREIRKTNRDLPVIMFSTLTERGGTATLEALSLGASDYVTKPANVGSVGAAMESVERELIPKIKSLCRPKVQLTFPPLSKPVVNGTPSGLIDVVAIGSSTGGPNALGTVLAALPARLRVPVVVTQHMPAVFTRLLAERLDNQLEITVREAADGDLLTAGTVYIAPGDHHMSMRRVARGVQVELNQDPPVNYCRPSVDVMFDAVAKCYRGNVLGVILTGMGHDGREGCATFKQLGAHVVAQDQASSVVWGMPGAVATAGLADEVLPLDVVGHRIAELTSTMSTRTRPLSVGATR